MKGQHTRNLYAVLNEVRQLEGGENKLSNIFTEMLKDEINVLDEQQIYNNLHGLIDKYKDDQKALRLIDEVFEELCNGATLSEIFLIAKDEILSPTPINAMELDGFNNFTR